MTCVRQLCSKQKNNLFSVIMAPKYCIRGRNVATVRRMTKNDENDAACTSHVYI